MKQGLLILFVLCASAIAMVPRDKRALPSEDIKEHKAICAVNTPCAWKIYKPQVKQVEMTLVNTYCVCDARTECQIDDDDTVTSAYVLHCLPPNSSKYTEDS